MSTGGSNRVEMKRMVICYRRKSGIKNAGPRSKCCPGNCCFVVPKRRRLETSPLRFLRNLRDTAITALCMVPLFRKKPSPKISSLVKSTPSSDPHRNESVEACIQYINSSSSTSSSSSSSTSSSSSSSSSQSESTPSTEVSKSG